MADLTFDKFDKIKGHRTELRRFVRLTRKKRKLEADLRRVKEQISELASDGDEMGPLLKAFVDNGINNIPGVDGMTVYIKTDIFASIRSEDCSTVEEKEARKAEVNQTLRAIKMDDYVSEKFNGRGFGSYLKEQQQAKEADIGEIIEIMEVIPDPLKDLIKISEKYTLVGKDG